MESKGAEYGGICVCSGKCRHQEVYKWWVILRGALSKLPNNTTKQAIPIKLVKFGNVFDAHLKQQIFADRWKSQA